MAVNPIRRSSSAPGSTPAGSGGARSTATPPPRPAVSKPGVAKPVVTHRPPPSERKPAIAPQPGSTIITAPTPATRPIPQRLAVAPKPIARPAAPRVSPAHTPKPVLKSTPAPVSAPAPAPVVIEAIEETAALSVALPQEATRSDSSKVHVAAESVATDVEAAEAKPAPNTAASKASARAKVAKPRNAAKTLCIGLAAACVVMTIVCAVLFMRRGADSSSPMVAGEKNSEGGASSAAGVQNPGALLPIIVPPALPNLFADAVASGCERANLLVDGDATGADPNAFAYYDFKGNPNGGMVVTMPKACTINHIRFHLWDHDKRSYRTVLEGSVDGKAWKILVDSSKKDQTSWQEFDIPPQELKAVRLRGVHATADQNLHVFEIEASNSGPRGAPRTAPKGNVSELACKPGVYAQYFQGLGNYATVTDKPFFSRVETSMRFGVLPGAPKGQGPLNWPMQGPCAAVFSGFVKIETEALYTFFLESDDGARLYIDNELVADNDGMHGMIEIWGQADLTPGLHRIWVEYYNAVGPMGLNVSIKPKGGDKKPLNTELFYNPAEAK